MFCQMCGTKLADGINFCGNCGAPVQGGKPGRIDTSATRDSARPAAKPSSKGLVVMLVVAVTAIMTISGIIGINALSSMDAAADDMYNRGLRGVSNADDIKFEILYLARAYRNILILNDPKEPEIITAYEDVLNKVAMEFPMFIQELDMISTKAETKYVLRELEEAIHEYIEAGNQFVDMVRPIEVKIPQDLYNRLRELHAKGERAEIAAAEIADIFDETASAINDINAELYYNASKMLIILLVVGIALCATLGVVIVKR